MLRHILATLLVYCTTLTAFAQSSNASPALATHNRPSERSLSNWPDAEIGHTYSSSMDIVTLASPNLRQHCNLRKLTTDTITCNASHHNPAAVYQRNNILALLAPPEHDNLISFFEVGAIVGGVIALSLFVPFGWAIALRIVGGFFFYFGWAAIGEYADENLSDHNHDILLYQRPNTHLTIHLR